jgi:acetolactate synthase-1/2/3 large subunit
MKNKMSGAEAVINSLIEEGVEVLFGYIGGAIMPIYDALYDYSDSVNHVLTRHEQGAVHAAQGYARVSKKVGVCFATSGPGATNIITGLADAQLDSTPLVCITGQVHSSLLGSDAFQEQDIIGMSIPVTKWNYQITRPEEIPETLAKAFYFAKTGRPGPVLIDITKDAQQGFLDFFYQKCERVRSYFPYPKVVDDVLHQAASLINQSTKPFVLCGHGVLLSGAEKELIDFVNKTGIPIASTLLGLSAVNTNHPLYVGMLGMHGNYAPNVKTNECDLLIALGMRFDDRVTSDLNRYAKQAKIIHVEIDHSEIDKNVKVDCAILGDVKEVLGRLIEMVNFGRHEAWVSTFADCYGVENKVIIKEQCYPELGELKMGEVVKRISEMTNGEAIVVTDVGQNQMMAARYYDFMKANSFVTSGGLGTMGFGIPAAIGAKIAAPDREVILFVGDGGFQMTIQELATIKQLEMPIKIVLLNNNFLGMVRQWQEMFFNKRYSYTKMKNPDFIKIAEGYSLRAEKVSKRDELNTAIEAMLSSEETFILEVMVEHENNVMPMIPSGESVSNIRLK